MCTNNKNRRLFSTSKKIVNVKAFLFNCNTNDTVLRGFVHDFLKKLLFSIFVYSLFIISYFIIYYLSQNDAFETNE